MNQYDIEEYLPNRVGYKDNPFEHKVIKHKPESDWYTNNKEGKAYNIQGRFPANLILDGSEQVMGEFAKYGDRKARFNGGSGYFSSNPAPNVFHSDKRIKEVFGYGDNGSAARFFYGAKAKPNERGEGNNHPTVKSLALMEYLCRLTKSPFSGTVIDSFMGSGTTLIAAYNEGRKAIGIEISEEYCEIAVKRIKEHCKQLNL